MPYISHFTGAQMDQAFGNALNQRPRFTLEWRWTSGSWEDGFLCDFEVFDQKVKQGYLIDYLYRDDAGQMHTIPGISTKYSQEDAPYIREIQWIQDGVLVTWRWDESVQSYQGITRSSSQILYNSSIYSGRFSTGVLPTDFAILDIQDNSSYGFISHAHIGFCITGSEAGDVYWGSGSARYPAVLFANNGTWPYVFSSPGSENAGQLIDGTQCRRPILSFSPLQKAGPGYTDLSSKPHYRFAAPVIRAKSKIGVQIFMWFDDTAVSNFGGATFELEVEKFIYNVGGYSPAYITNLAEKSMLFTFDIDMDLNTFNREGSHILLTAIFGTV